jgi:hypothetical protein
MAKKKKFINLEAMINSQCSLPELLADDLLDFINDFQNKHPRMTDDEVMTALLAVHRIIISERE